MEPHTLCTYLRSELKRFDFSGSRVLQGFLFSSSRYPFYYSLGSNGEPLLFYLPAEYETQSDIESFVEGLRSRSLHVICVNYNDFSGITTSDSELYDALAGIFSDFLTMFDRNTYGFTQIIIMGKSLGCSFALDLGSRFSDRVTALILESAFLRFDDFLRRQGKESGVGDVTRNIEKMRLFKKPTLFLHSSRDELVTLSEIEWLVCESRSKGTQFQVMPAPTRRDFQRIFGDMYFDFLRDFIWQKTGRKPFRRKRQ